MVMPASSPPLRWTRTMLDALPDDGQRHEIIDGVHYVTVPPGTPHQIIVGELHVALHGFLGANPAGWVLLAPWDVALADDTVVEPDLLVVTRTNPRPPDAGAPGVVPILAIEILSPSTRSRDRIVKRPRYQRAGIAECWIANTESRVVERWRADDERPEIITDVLRWQPAGAAAPLAISLAPLFDLANPSG